MGASTFTWKKDESTGNYTTSTNHAGLVKRGGAWVLLHAGKEHTMPRGASFDHAEAKLAHLGRMASEAAATAPRDRAIEEIAARVLNIQTLQTRNSDRLDFYERGVGSLKRALEEAYAAGEKAGASTNRRKEARRRTLTNRSRL